MNDISSIHLYLFGRRMNLFLFLLSWFLLLMLMLLLHRCHQRQRAKRTRKRRTKKKRLERKKKVENWWEQGWRLIYVWALSFGEGKRIMATHRVDYCTVLPVGACAAFPKEEFPSILFSFKLQQTYLWILVSHCRSKVLFLHWQQMAWNELTTPIDRCSSLQN